MKGHKSHHHRKHKAHGGETLSGKADWKDDLSHNPEARDNAHKIEGEAEARKHGGRTARKHGGMIHHEKMEHMKHAKHVGKVHGEHAHHHAGRKPRKSGGRAGADMNPLSSAHKGMEPKKHKSFDIE
jgi:hypothetical protein